MHSRTYQLFVATALSIAVPSMAVMAASPSSTKQEIQSNYNKIASAITRKDVRSATSYFTNDYVGIDNKGNRRNAEEMRQYYSSIMPAQVKIVKNQIAIQDFNTNSNVAQVVIKQRADLTFGSSKIVSQNTYQDLWVKTPQGWRLKQSQNTSSSTTLNGKPISS
jgi:ketosteroid isomerase-like protein